MTHSKTNFYAHYGLLILCVVFFLVPFGLRGARMALERMENNVKDWLPRDFEETQELAWFAQRFEGQQQFLLMTWEGCADDDRSFDLLVEKLRNEIVPDEEDEPAEPQFDPADPTANDGQQLNREQLQRRLEERRAYNTSVARAMGDKLGLFTTGNYFHNWGGLNEKWLMGRGNKWYYITPDGELYRWTGRNDVVDAVRRAVRRNVLGNKSIEGEYITRLGSLPTPDATNDFYADPRRATSRVLKTVMTGPEVLDELTQPGGALYPIGGDMSPEQRAIEARRLGINRLTGSLFGPGVFEDYDWTPAGLKSVLDEKRLAKLPEDWETRADAYLTNLVQRKFKGDRAALAAAQPGDKDKYFNQLCAELEIEPPGIQTCIVLTLSDAGSADLRQVIGRGLLGKPRGKLIDLADESGVDPPPSPALGPFSREAKATGRALRMGGPPVDNVAIDEEGSITLVRLVGFSLVLGVLLSYVSFRSVKITIMIFFVGGVSAIASLSIVWWSGRSVDAILMSMPSLVYVLGLSGAVHIVNYYREARESHGIEGAAERAARHGFAPCTLAAFTTALGLVSLSNSNIYPIKKFGLFSAFGVMATVILLFTYLPSALQMWPPKMANSRTGGDWQKYVVAGWDRVARFVIRRNGLVSTVCLLAMLGFGYGLTKINTSIQLLELFDSNAKIIQDYHWLEGNLGKLVPMEVVVRVDESKLRAPIDELANAETNSEQKYQYSFLERIEMTAQIHRAVEDVFGEDGQNKVGRGMSAATFTPPILKPNDRQRISLNKVLEDNRERLLEEDYLAYDTDDTSELWRISIRLGALQDIDYGVFVSDLRNVVQPVVSAYEYRDQILRRLEAQRDKPEIKDTTIWNGARVCILGAPVPGKEDSDFRPDADGNIPQTALFADTLWRLLTAKGFRSGDAKRVMMWHDPQTRPFVEGYATSDAWAKALSSFDVVVVVDRHADYDMNFIRQHASKHGTTLIDVTANGGISVTPTNQVSEGHGPIDITYTGVVPIVYKAQRTLLNSLISSIGSAFVMIAVVMTVLLLYRSFRPINAPAGMLSMLPNIFPVVIIFGYMGHRGVAVDIGTMMCASVAMGVAVDDTIHFLTWFRLGIRQGMSRHEAIREAFRRVAPAMTQTTLIGGLGLSVFALSTFTPTQRFGVMMLTLLAAALIGDLIMLPALLASPLGRCFCPKPDKNKSDETPESTLESVSADAALAEHSPHEVPPMHQRQTQNKLSGERTPDG